MDALKIRGISLRPSARRTLEFTRSFFAAKGLALDVDWAEAATPEEAAVLVQDAAAEFRSVRIEPCLSGEALALCPSLPIDVSTLKTADVFFSRDKGWEPGLCLFTGLHEALIASAKSLDLRMSAYVIGKGSYVRQVAAAVLGLGYRRVVLVAEDEADLHRQKEILTRVYVGAECVVLPSYQLTLQTVGASLVVNATDLTDEKELAGDLAYFNFMSPGGLVVDLEDPSDENPLLEEAGRAGLRILPSHQVQAWIEWTHVKGLCLDSQTTPLEFMNAYFDSLRSSPKT